MTTHCSQCHKKFNREGFCPYDGTPLEPGEAPSAQQTVQAVSAADDPTAALANLKRRSSEYDRLIGVTLEDRYRVDSKLGEGGMGVVFKGTHVIIEKIVAIKVLKREVARDQSIVKRFIQEAKAASRIGHPHIVDVTDFGTTSDGLTYSVMEFVDTDTLKQVMLESGPFPVKRAVRVAAQIADALQAAHAKGIVHRDLKPENIFVGDRDGLRDFVKICDFGIAKVTPAQEHNQDAGARLTVAGSVFGTPEYMAPEQAAGRTDTDRRVDVYALGGILYEMLTGTVPHKGESPVRTLAMQMLDDVEPLRKRRPELAISDGFEAMVLKTLAKKRDERYPSMAAVLKALRDVAGHALIDQITGQFSAPNIRSRLSPLPPGADSNAIAAPSSPGQTFARSGDANANITSLDPALITKLPHDVGHAVDDDQVQPSRKGRLLLIALALAVLVGGAAALTVMSLRDDKSDPLAHNDRPIDAGSLPTEPDAQSIPDAMDLVDAHKEVIVRNRPRDRRTNDGTRRITTTRKRSEDAGTRIVARRTPNAGKKVGTNPPVVAYHTIKVISKPEGATLYVDGGYRGTSESRFRRRIGSKITVECTKPGYAKGRVTIVFDGTRDFYSCRLKRQKKCVKGVKNPFDDCPDE